MWLARYFVIFIFYSLLGWIFETVYCTLKEKKWCDRGFLYGPIVPIYGAGGLGITAVMDGLQQFVGIRPNALQVFLIAYLGSIVLEFGTSYVLEKLFHAVWWDYSDMPFNIQGRICLPASIGFGLAGLLIVYGIYPFVNRIFPARISIFNELLAMFLVFLIACDCALTVSALTGLAKNIMMMEDNINRQMSTFVEGIREKGVDIEAHMEANREKLSREYAEHVVGQMNVMQQKALQRVKAFRPSRPELAHSDRVKHVFEAIRRRRDGYKR